MTTNDPKHQRETLVCKGRARVAYKTDPRLLNFGRLTRHDGPQHKTVRITAGDGGPLSLEVLPAKNPGVEAALRQVKAGEEYELEVTIKPPLPAGKLRERVKLKTGIARVPELAIPVHATIAPRVQANPPKISIPDKAASTVVKTVRLVWDDQSRPKILEASANDPALTVRIDEKDGEQVVVVEAPPAYKPAQKLTLVAIRTDDTEVPVVEVAVKIRRPRSSAKRPPDPTKLRASPTSKTSAAKLAGKKRPSRKRDAGCGR